MKKFALVFAALALVACNTPAGTDTAVDLEDPAQRGSYAQGYQIGSQGQELPIETGAFVQGIRDGLAGSGQLSDDELQQALMEFQNLVTEAMEEANRTKGEANRAAGEAFLAENASREGVMVTESGLQYQVLVQGDGPQPVAEDTVTVHYRGTLLDGTEFDSSIGGEPATFPLNRVIEGWTEGVQLMNVGSKFTFWIPGDLAYGPNPRPGGPIGPNATLVFEVELLGIEGR